MTFANPVAARAHGIVTVHQEADLFGTLSVAENMALEQGLPARPGGWIRWRAIHEQARQAVDVLGEPLDIRQPAARLSVAQRHMTQIAAAVAQRARVLVLDEPTSALTGAETAWLFSQISRLKAAGVGIIYISHRQEEIFQLADRITVLRDGRRVWSGPRDAIDRSGLIRQMVGRGCDTMARTPGALPRGVPRLQVTSLTAADNRCADVSLTVHAGEIVGVYGLIGSGRSEFARAVFGLDKSTGGTITIDGQPRTIANPGDAVVAGLAYLPEDRLRQGVFRELTVRANAVLTALRPLGRGPLTSVRRVRTVTRQQIDRLAIRCRDSEQPIGELSGGNQQKVVLARCLLARPAVLILDEPTRGVDVAAKAEIHRILRHLAADGTAIVLISSDLPEVTENSDRVIVFRAGRVAAEFNASQFDPERIADAALPDHSTAKAAARVTRQRARRGPATRLVRARVWSRR